jgi:hypothetical protein
MGAQSSTSRTQNNSPWAAPLGQYGENVNAVTLPVLRSLGTQILQALNTGGVGARVPAITSAVDASRQANSDAATSTAENLAAGGAGGSSFAADVLAQQQMQGNEATGAIPGEVAGEIAGEAPGIGTYGGGESAESEAGALQNTRFNKTSELFNWGNALAGAGIAGGAALAGGAVGGPLGAEMGAQAGSQIAGAAGLSNSAPAPATPMPYSGYSSAAPPSPVPNAPTTYQGYNPATQTTSI